MHEFHSESVCPTGSVIRRLIERLRTEVNRLTLVLTVVTLTVPFGGADDRVVEFSREVLPILSNKCFVCHGPTAAEIDADMLRLDSQEGATSDRGGYRAIDPDDLSNSRLLHRIYSADDPMPPADAEKQLTQQERLILDQWVRQGGTYARHWAFVRPETPEIPASSTQVESGAIDAFVERGLKSAGTTFAKTADAHVLARRVSLILTGLPPDPEQLAAFLVDESDGAWSRYIDRLLASPGYGEHQARYWLDAVRYGDTHGLHLDNRRGIFPYRDWVVRAMNRNMPMDQFIVWQLAGDLLPNPTLEQRVATGFVRMNPSTAEGGAIPEEFQAKNNFDRTETLGTVLLGMSLTCARCHTHKYDPIAHTEYYELLAFFNSTAEHSMDGNKYEYGPVISAPSDQSGWDAWDDLQASSRRLTEHAAGLIGNGVTLDETAGANWNKANTAQRLAIVADMSGAFHAHEMHEQARKLVAEISAAEKGFTTTLVAQELAKPRHTRLLNRGEYNLPVGESLTPDVPSIMGELPADAPRNRLGLARWLTSREHPLVARVVVNRMWQQVYGYGLVRTPEDFGLQGQQPTHPELLDWLAVELQESGWDMQHMLRLMVTSRTFRQSSAWRPDVDDPENRLFARASSYRLDAEVLRDIALWASGLLDPHRGGEGVKPYQPAGMWKAMAHPGSNTKLYERDTGNRLYRRSLYVYWKRTSPHPMMTLFDAPDRESSCVRRARTSTSLQSLGLLNEIQRIEMSRKLAERLLNDADSDKDRVDLLFGLLTSRPATDTEMQVCLELVQSLRKRYQAAPDDADLLLAIGEADRDDTLDSTDVAAWSQVATIVLASDAALMVY
jgi:Protein of unknown function (DUF1553)/Protein of unknown function (DUF1549)/Planctomycete cytochrome C